MNDAVVDQEQDTNLEQGIEVYRDGNNTNVTEQNMEKVYIHI